MLNFSAPKFFQHTAVAALALALTACGGDGGGSASSVGDAMLRVFTTPSMTIFSAGVSKNAEGKEVLEIADPNLGKKTAIIESRDAEGNVTALASEGPFSDVTSLLGNRVGMLCRPDLTADGRPLYHDLEPAQIGQYVYLSNDFTEVAPGELLGKRFITYDDCKNTGAILADARDDFMQIFTEAGLEEHDEYGVSVTRGKTYKYNAHGKTTYVYVGVDSGKTHETADSARYTKDSVFFGISQ